MVLQHSQLRRCLHMHTPTQQKEEREKPLAWRHWQQRIKEMAATWKSEECIGENGHRMDAGNLYFTLMCCYLESKIQITFHLHASILYLATLA